MLLRVKDVARILSVSERAVYHLAESRIIPTIKWNKSVRFDPIDVAKFIDDNRREAIDYEALAETRCL